MGMYVIYKHIHTITLYVFSIYEKVELFRYNGFHKPFVYNVMSFSCETHSSKFNFSISLQTEITKRD